jgi:hypothetical protein
MKKEHYELSNPSYNGVHIIIKIPVENLSPEEAKKD